MSQINTYFYFHYGFIVNTLYINVIQFRFITTMITNILVDIYDMYIIGICAHSIVLCWHQEEYPTITHSLNS